MFLISWLLYLQDHIPKYFPQILGIFMTTSSKPYTISNLFLKCYLCTNSIIFQLGSINQAFKMSRADSCTSGIVIVFRIVIQTKTAWKVHFSFMFWRCYCQLLFLSQLTQYWLILCSWSSKSVIIGLLHSHNWLKSQMFVNFLKFYSCSNIWCTWIGSEYFKSLFYRVI